MSDRVILAVKFTAAGTGAQVRRAVGGFLRYVQHRDLHPTQSAGQPRPEVSGLLKYVAYRDRASTRAELFGPDGPLSTDDRKAFAAFVATALDRSRPQLFRARNGEMHDRRRAVYRLVISPERASGLDLRRLSSAAVSRLERESGMSGLRWIAAIHRNTTHHHVHLVVAGMHLEGVGTYHRVDLTRQRLAAMKEELALEIQRQRAEPTPERSMLRLPGQPAPPETRVALEEAPPPWRSKMAAAPPRRWRRSSATHGSLISLRAVARRYQRRMEHDLEEAYRQAQRDYAA